MDHLTTFFTYKPTRATGSAFILLGLLFGTWTTFIPALKSKFGFNDEQLGYLLLCLPIGATSFNMAAPIIIRKMGMGKATVLGMVVISIFFGLIMAIENIYLLAANLICAGMCISLLNVAMNTCASTIESNQRVSIMSTAHGVFSLGLVIGSFLASMYYGTGLNPLFHFVLICSFGIILSFSYRKTLDEIYLKVDENISDTNAEVPVLKKEVIGILALMILVGICTNFTEGVMADWTAVYMTDIVKSPKFMVGLGLTGYALFMAIGRFTGDAIIPKFGRKNVLIFGSLFALLGTSFSIILPNPYACIIGFSLVGFGVSFASPILYGSAARIPGYGDGKGLAIMNTFSMLGFLTGPVIIGFLSNMSDLRHALIMLPILALVWGIGSKFLKLF